MNTYELIKKKRDGFELTGPEIRYLVDGYVNSRIPDYQMAAFLMSVFFRGMTNRECIDLTMCMADSGDRVDLSPIAGFKVDKHSTGGVGDTTTLVLAPLVAACGGTVAKMTGRELGHTGGTVDKLESIPGLQMELTREKFIHIANTVGVSLLSQSDRLAPADKLIYALRNVTATVESIPLIAGSIMSKKLAAGADGIVLDVKTGAGSFMTRYEDAIELARMMVHIGVGAGKKIIALITGMEQPLGNAIGNAVEIGEAIDTLNGKGPSDLVDLVLEIGSDMLVMSGISMSRSAAREILLERIHDGSALLKLKEFVQAQGGNPRVIDNPELLPQPAEAVPVKSEKSGVVERLDALKIGMAAKLLGAGRKTKDDPIDHSIGIILHKKIGDRVTKGETLATFHSDGDPDKLEPARSRFQSACSIVESIVDPPRLFYARVTEDGIEELGD